MIGGFPLSSLTAPDDKRTSAAIRARAKHYLLLINVGIITLVAIALGVFAGCGIINKGVVDEPPFIVAMVMVVLTLLLPLKNVHMIRTYNRPENQLDSTANWGRVGANNNAPESDSGDTEECKEAEALEEGLVSSTKKRRSQVAPEPMATTTETRPAQAAWQ